MILFYVIDVFICFARERRTFLIEPPSLSLFFSIVLLALMEHDSLILFFFFLHGTFKN